MNLTHELHRIPPAAGWLAYAVERALVPLGWKLESVRGGANSYRLLDPTGEARLHFRSYHPHETVIARKTPMGATVATLRSRVDVVRLIEGLTS